MTTQQMLVTLSDDKGTPYGRLEYATGRLYTLDGKYERTLSAGGVGRNSDAEVWPDDGDALMSQFAASVDVEARGKAIRKRLELKDGGGRRGETKVLMDLAVGDVHIPSAMPNVALGYRLGEGVADVACPVVPATKQSDYWFTWDSANAYQPVVATQGTSGGPPHEVNPTLSSTKYSALEYSLAGFIPTEIEANADAPLRPYQAAVTRVMNALRMNREFRVKTLLVTSGNWNANNVLALAAGSQWNGGANGDPIANIQYIQERSYEKISRIVMGEPVFHAMQRSSAVRQYFFAKSGDDTAFPTPDMMSALFNLPPIVVATMKFTSAAGAPTYVWPSAAGSSSSVVLLHEPAQNPPSSGEENATAYTYRWIGASAPDGTVTGGFLVRSYYDPRRGARGGRIIVLVHNDAEVVTGPILGGLITGVIQ